MLFPAVLIVFPNSKVCLTREWTIGPTDDVFWLSTTTYIKNCCLLVLCWSPLFIRIENAGSLSNISCSLEWKSAVLLLIMMALSLSPFVLVEVEC